MAHSNQDAAARAVKNSLRQPERVDTRTPEERISAIRGSIVAGLFIPKHELQFFLDRYDAIRDEFQQTLATRDEEIARLYDKQNQPQAAALALKVDRFAELMQAGTITDVPLLDTSFGGDALQSQTIPDIAL